VEDSPDKIMNFLLKKKERQSEYEIQDESTLNETCEFARKKITFDSSENKKPLTFKNENIKDVELLQWIVPLKTKEYSLKELNYKIVKIKRKLYECDDQDEDECLELSERLKNQISKITIEEYMPGLINIREYKIPQEVGDFCLEEIVVKEAHLELIEPLMNFEEN
jgi:hypothetical protein